jgi:hypothetical protein
MDAHNTPVFVQVDLPVELWERVITTGRLTLRGWAGLRMTCRGLRNVLQPKRISCIQPESVLELAAAARHWQHAEMIRLDFENLWVIEHRGELDGIIEAASGLSDLHRLQLVEDIARPGALWGEARQFQVRLRERLL